MLSFMTGRRSVAVNCNLLLLLHTFVRGLNLLKLSFESPSNLPRSSPLASLIVDLDRLLHEIFCCSFTHCYGDSAFPQLNENS
jgi:hypothetical protein